MAMLITALSLQATEYIEKNVVLKVGQKFQEKLTWGWKDITTSNINVARCYKEDLRDVVIVGVNRGRALITVDDGYGVRTWLYRVQVIDVVSITIPKFISLSVGGDYKFSPIFHDTGVTAPLTWQSADENVVTVAEDGTVSAVAEGKAVVICSTDNGITAQCLIEVRKNKSNSRAACDTNGDGDVNSADIVTVVNAIMEPELEEKE